MSSSRLAACLLCASSLFISSCYQTAKLVAQGDSKELIERKEAAPENSPALPSMLVLALDGVGRDLLYDLLNDGQLPNLEKLLGGRSGGKLAHAYLDERYFGTLPTTTMPAWATAFTGVGSAYHGLTGNEFFIREDRRLAAPVPVSFSNAAVSISSYTDNYTNDLLGAPTVYERMRRRDPHIQIWVAMHPIYAGADRLLTVDRAVLAGALKAFLSKAVEETLDDEKSRAVYEELDEEVIEAAVEELDEDSEPLPDVLTVYLVGIDAYAHVATSGPDAARREYLKEVLDPALADLYDELSDRDALADRYVVVTADHGHTQVKHDEKHALDTDEEKDPPALLEAAGFRVRPFELDVSDDDDFQAVLAYQGAIAYVYLADRSTCPKKGNVCDWKKPPRYEQDVLAAAEAFFRNNETGKLVPELKGTLDMVLARKPKPYDEKDEPFQVYVGDGKLEPVGKHVDDTYPYFEVRLRDLAVGPHGERAGDLLLLAHNGDRKKAEDRYYFSHKYHSWHGSPSRRDSELPLIVAHPGKSPDEIGWRVRRALGEAPFQQRLTDLLIDLRYGAGTGAKNPVAVR